MIDEERELPAEEKEVAKGFDKRAVYVFILSVVVLALGITAEEIIRRKKLSDIRKKHKEIYELIRKTEENLDNKGLAQEYYNRLREEAGKHARLCTKKEYRFITKEISHLYTRMRRKK